MGPALGTLLGTGLIYGFTSLMDNETFLAWGWRIPFLLSLALVTFGLWVRSGVEKSPMFKHLEEAHTKAKAPIKEVVTTHWRRLLLAGGSRIGGDVLYGLIVVFTLTYVTTVLQLPKSTALMALLIGTGFNALAVPLFAILSDHWGRRPVLALGVVSAIVWAFLMFALLDTTQTLAIVLASVGGLIVHAVSLRTAGIVHHRAIPHPHPLHRRVARLQPGICPGAGHTHQVAVDHQAFIRRYFGCFFDRRCIQAPRPATRLRRCRIV